jgi:hypothetical protein
VQEVLQRLRDVLETWIKETKDQGAFPEPPGAGVEEAKKRATKRAAKPPTGPAK